MRIVGYHSFEYDMPSIVCADCAGDEGISGIDDPEWTPVYDIEEHAATMCCDSVTCGHQALLEQ